MPNQERPRGRHQAGSQPNQPNGYGYVPGQPQAGQKPARRQPARQGQPYPQQAQPQQQPYAQQPQQQPVADQQAYRAPASGRQPAPNAHAAYRTQAPQGRQQGMPQGQGYPGSAYNGAGGYPPSGYQPGAPSFNQDNLVRVKKKKKKRHTGLIVTLLVIVVLLVGVGVAGFNLYGSAKTLQAEASTVMTDVSDIQSLIVSGDYAAAETSARAVQTKAEAMQEELSSPLWSVAAMIPVYGEDIKGVQSVVGVLQDASANALVPLTQSLAATPPSSLISTDGSINVVAVESLLGSLQTAAPVMQRCTDSLEALPTMHIAQLESVFGKARDKITGINDAFQQANAFAPVVGTVLGIQGERTYLIAAQNSAEIRSSGGFPGSCGTLSITNGAIELGDFNAVRDMLSTSMPASISITDEEHAVFGNHIDTPWDACIDPDFTRVAEIWSASYTEKTGESVDGVISMTPAIVQKILAIVGPITLSDGTVLDGTNATQVLQHDLYWKYLSGDSASTYTDELTNALFAEAADLAFNKMLSDMNTSTLMALSTAFMEGINDRTIMLWLSNPAEQAQITSIDCSGALNSDAANPEIGVYVSDWSVSKLGWYYNVDTSVIEQGKNADGSTSYQVQVKLSNSITAEEAAEGGIYLVGNNPISTTPGEMVTYLYLYAPAGGTISSISASDSTSFTNATHDNLQMAFGQTTIKPGQSDLFTYTVTTSTEQTSPLGIGATPTLQEYR